VHKWDGSGTGTSRPEPLCNCCNSWRNAHFLFIFPSSIRYGTCPVHSYYTFIRLHSLWPLSNALIARVLSGEKPPLGAVPRIEPGLALQQASELWYQLSYAPASCTAPSSAKFSHSTFSLPFKKSHTVSYIRLRLRLVNVNIRFFFYRVEIGSSRVSKAPPCGNFHHRKLTLSLMSGSCS
jgi:hypothetical protein